MWPKITEEILNGKLHFLCSEISRITAWRETIVQKKLFSNFTECFKFLQNALVAEYLNWCCLSVDDSTLHIAIQWIFSHWLSRYLQEQPSNSPTVFYITAILRNAVKPIQKISGIESYLSKFAGSWASPFTKKALHCRCFPFRFMKYFRTGFSKKSSERRLPEAVTGSILCKKVFLKI